MIIISPEVMKKLTDKHSVSRVEVEQCFANLAGWFLEDTRTEHKRWPPTQWFIAETNKRRRLKVVFQDHKDGDLIVLSAFEPNEVEERIYTKHGL